MGEALHKNSIYVGISPKLQLSSLLLNFLRGSSGFLFSPFARFTEGSFNENLST